MDEKISMKTVRDGVVMHKAYACVDDVVRVEAVS